MAGRRGTRRMRLLHIVGAVVAASTVLAGGAGEARGAESRAAATTQVTAGHARFEFLTPSLVRLEYSPSGAFLDAPTAVVEKRSWPAVPVTTTRAGGWITIKSSAVT